MYRVGSHLGATPRSAGRVAVPWPAHSLLPCRCAARSFASANSSTPTPTNLGKLSARLQGPQASASAAPSAASASVQAVSSGFGPRRITPSRVPVSKRNRPPTNHPATSATPTASAEDVDTSFLTSPSTARRPFQQPPPSFTVPAASTRPAHHPTAETNGNKLATAAHTPVTGAHNSSPVEPRAPEATQKPAATETKAESKGQTQTAAEAIQVVQPNNIPIAQEAATSVPAAAAVAPATAAEPVRAAKLTPEELRKKFPFAKNLSSVQPARVTDDNKYFKEGWFLTPQQEKKRPPVVVDQTRDLPEAYIARPNQLTELSKYLARSPIVAVDTEFYTHNLYRPSLQVLQIATPELLAAVDVQLLEKSPEFKAMLEQLLEKEWVVHAHRGDLEVIYDTATKLQLKRVTPRKVFDTQVAVAFLSPTGAIAYASMLQDLLGIDIEKTSALSDWSRRPLTVAQIEYALQDVKYLLQAKAKLEKFLSASTAEHNAFLAAADPSTRVAGAKASSSSSGRALSRLQWFSEEMSLLLSPSLYSPVDPSMVTQAMWSRRHFDEGSLARKVFDRVGEWREKMAIQRDTMPAYILSSDHLLAMARTPPADMEALQQLPAMKRFVMVEFGEELLQVVQAAVREHADAQAGLTPIVDEDLLPDHNGSNRVRFELLSILGALIEQRAATMGISSFLLAPRRDRSDLSALSQPAIREAAQWAWKGLLASDGTKDGFWPSLQPASVNYRFAATNVTEQTMFNRLVSEEVAAWVKDAGVRRGEVALGATELAGAPPASSPSSSSPSSLISFRPASSLAHSTALTLLRFSKLLRGWRREVIGQEVLEFLEGKKVMKWEWTKEGGGRIAVHEEVESFEARPSPKQVTKATPTVEAPIVPEAVVDSKPSAGAGAAPAPSTKKRAAAKSAQDKAAAAEAKAAEKAAKATEKAAKAAEKAAMAAEKQRIAAEKAEQKRLAAETKAASKKKKTKTAV